MEVVLACTLERCLPETSPFKEIWLLAGIPLVGSVNDIHQLYHNTLLWKGVALFGCESSLVDSTVGYTPSNL